MKTFRRVVCLVAIISIGFGFLSGIPARVRATNAPQTLPFQQNWSNASMIAVNNDWSGVPGIIGYRGNDLNTTIGADLRTVLADGSATAVGVVANQTSPDLSAAFGANGVLEFDGVGNRTIAVRPSVDSDVPHIVVSLDTTGKSNIQLSYITRDLNTYVGTGNQQINTQFRIGGSGDYANVAGGYTADASGPGTGMVNSVNVTLPPSANDQPLVEVRIMSINASAVNVIGIDDISVTGTPTNAAQTLPFHQDWSTTTLITGDDDWSEVPGIVGYRGDGLSTNADPRTILADGSGTPVDVLANCFNPSLFFGVRAVFEFDAIADPTIGLSGGSPVFNGDVPHIVIALNTSGMTNVHLSFNARDLDASDAAVQQINTQVRIGGVGDYANVEGGYIPDASGSGSTLVTPVSVYLPPSADDQALVEIRIMTVNEVGGDEIIGIDDIHVSGTDAQTPPFDESWSDPSLISVDDDWSDVPGIVGYRGDDLSTIPDEDLRTIVADGSDTPVDVNANESDPDTLVEGGVIEFDGLPDPTIALKGTETADVPHIVLALDTSGLSNVQVSYNANCLSGSSGLASACTTSGPTTSQQVNTQGRLGLTANRSSGETGDYMNLAGGYIADASGPDMVTPVSLTLPAWADDQPFVEVRIMTLNASGDDAYIGIDDIEVTGTVIPAPGTVGVSIPTDLAGINGSTLTVPINVDNVSGMGILSYDFTVTFDPSVMSPNTVNFDVGGTLSNGYTITTNPSSPGILVVSGFGTSALTGSGALLNLRFDLVGDAPACSPVSFSSFQFNEGDPPAQATGGEVCVIAGTISGQITYGNAATETGVQDVLVTADGAPMVTDLSDAGGLYEVSGLGAGPYVVTPTKTGDVNGISAFDAALVAQGVVGIITLTPNQTLAADVSNNGTITSFDSAQIAQFVIDIPNTSVAGTWIFSPDSRDYPSTTSPQTDEDYKAILMGEVSGNWTPPALSGRQKPSLARTNATHVSLPNLNGLPDTILSIPVIIAEDLAGSGVLSYEIDLNYDPSVLQPEVSFADTNGTLSSGRLVTVNNSTPGRSRLAVFGTSPLTGQGALINMRFRIIGTLGQTSAMTWTRFVFNEGEPTSITANGLVTVASPTTVPVSVTGQVFSADGRGISKTMVTIADGGGLTQHALTNAFGYFRFDAVASGQMYTIGVSRKGYEFANPTQVVFVGGEVANVVFVASP